MIDNSHFGENLLPRVAHGLLDPIINLYIEHYALVRFLEQTGTLDKEAFAAFCSSYHDTHYTEIAKALVTVFKECLQDRPPSEIPPEI